MSCINYITDILNLKDKNILFKENCYFEVKIKGITHKVFEGYFSYQPTCCSKCGVAFDKNFEKHGFIRFNKKTL